MILKLGFGYILYFKLWQTNPRREACGDKDPIAGTTKIKADAS
jgi:hypothetical protein